MEMDNIESLISKTIYKASLYLDEFRWDDLKEIRFKIMDGTQFEIGDFQIIEFRGNPKKPTKWKRI